MKHRIAVLGAGYAGAHAAGRLAKRLRAQDIDITVVNSDPEFVERVRMHQLASGQDLPVRPLRDVFAGTGITLQIAQVTSVDADRKTVHILGERGAETVDYDTLVYALGSTVADHGVPGVTEHAHAVAGKGAALRLRERLGELTSGATVLVVGGGLTGIETATELAEAHPNLQVAIAARGRVGGWLSDKAQHHLRAVLDRLGITVHDHADITRVTAAGVVTTNAGEIPAQVTVWTAGFTVHPIAAATTLAVNDTGRIIVDGSMRSVSHPDVYAIGDAAFAEGEGGQPLRMSCASGTPMAWRAADAIAARLTGRDVPTGAIGYVLQCISLGRGDAVVQRVTPDDQVTPSALTGRRAVWVKELICAAAGWGVSHPTMLMPSRRRRVTVTEVQHDALAQ